jgi:hypothetical protein
MSEFRPVCFDPYAASRDFLGDERIDDYYFDDRLPSWHELTDVPLGLGAAVANYQELQESDPELAAAIESAALKTPGAGHLQNWATRITRPDSKIGVKEGHDGVAVPEKAPIFFAVTPRSAPDRETFITNTSVDGTYAAEKRVILLPNQRMQDPGATAEPIDAPSGWAASASWSLRRSRSKFTTPVCVSLNLDNIKPETREAILAAARAEARSNSGPSLLAEFDDQYPDADYEVTVVVPLALNLEKRKPAAGGGRHRRSEAAAARAAFAPLAAGAVAALAANVHPIEPANTTPPEDNTETDRPQDDPRHAQLLGALAGLGVRIDTHAQNHDLPNANRVVPDSPEAIAAMKRHGDPEKRRNRWRWLAGPMALVMAATSLVAVHRPEQPQDTAPHDPKPVPVGPKPVKVGVGSHEPPVIVPHTTEQYLWSAFQHNMQDTQGGNVVSEDVTTKLNSAIDAARANNYQVVVVDDTTGKVVDHLGDDSHFSVRRIVTPDGQVITDANVDGQYGTLMTQLQKADAKK